MWPDEEQYELQILNSKYCICITKFKIKLNAFQEIKAKYGKYIEMDACDFV